MANRHRKEFFGSSTGILFDSDQWSSPTIFLTLIKKKEDGSWEKPSQNEGKTVKFTLEEVAFILRVIRGEWFVWKTVHFFGGQETSISFEWDSEHIDRVMVKAGDYQKLLTYGEIEVFKALLPHIFQEKVIASTEVKKPNGSKNEVGFKLEGGSNLTITEETYSSEGEHETAILEGLYKGETEKALLIDLKGAKEIWVPKSIIHSRYNSKETAFQEFKIDTWILKKNNITFKQTT